MKKVIVRVTMQNGTGFGVFIKIEDQNLFFSQSAQQNVNLRPNFYIATIGGHEPSNATVTIEFIQDDATIAQQSFSTPTFFGFMPFTVN